jgi:hypothetical protein
MRLAVIGDWSGGVSVTCGCVTRVGTPGKDSGNVAVGTATVGGIDGEITAVGNGIDVGCVNELHAALTIESQINPVMAYRVSSYILVFSLRQVASHSFQVVTWGLQLSA